MSSNVVVTRELFYFLSVIVVVEERDVEDLGMYVDDVYDERRMWSCPQATAC